MGGIFWFVGTSLACLLILLPAPTVAEPDVQPAGKATAPSPEEHSIAPLQNTGHAGTGGAEGVDKGSGPCPERPDPSTNKPFADNPSNLVVELDPNTLWRPRGSEVRFTVKGAGGGTITISKVKVCFSWADGSVSAKLAQPAQQAQPAYGPLPSLLVRSISNAVSVAEYGASVPFLNPVPVGWLGRVFGDTRFQYTGFFIVPIADMLVEVTTEDKVNSPIVVRMPVGVTSVWFALVSLIAFLALAFLTFSIIFRGLRFPGANVLLKLISTRDGYASLSQFQIVLWTAVVALAAIYVMILSGNLIDITNGTLALLGIAGASALLARIPTANDDPKPQTDDHQKKAAQALDQTVTAAQASAEAAKAGKPDDAAANAASASAFAAVAHATASAAQTHAVGAAAVQIFSSTPRTPRWSDMVIVVSGDHQEIDVTRVQMLIFTVIAAAFVAIKVGVSYEIPVIPDNFLLLIGVSNGVYVTGRHLNTKPKSDR